MAFKFTKMNLIFINNRHLGGSQTGILPLSKIPMITGTYQFPYYLFYNYIIIIIIIIIIYI